MVSRIEMLDELKNLGMGHLSEPYGFNDLTFIKNDEGMLERYYHICWLENYSEDMNLYRYNYHMLIKC